MAVYRCTIARTFTVCNAGNSPLARNLAVSCNRTGVPLVFFGADRKAIQFLRDVAHTVNFSSTAVQGLNITSGAGSRSALYGSREFHRLAWMRYDIIKVLLRSGKSAVYLDTDIVVYRNYEQEIHSLLEGHCDFDGVIQTNHNGRPCTGFMAFHHRASERFDHAFSESTLEAYGYQFLIPGESADQRYMDEIVSPQSGGELLRMHLLDPERFPNGTTWYRHHDRLRESVSLVHYNGVIGQNRKILRMRKYGDWLPNKPTRAVVVVSAFGEALKAKFRALRGRLRERPSQRV